MRVPRIAESNVTGALVLVTTSFPIAGDGSEAAGSFVADLARQLSARFTVRVVAPGRAQAREQWGPNVEVYRYAAPERPLSTLKLWKIRDVIEILRVSRGGARATREAVEAGRTAHILALWAVPSGEWARRVARAYQVPYSVWTLGSDIWTWGTVPVARHLLKRVLARAHTIFSDGLQLACDTRRLCGREVEFLPSTRRILRMRVEPPASGPPYRLVFLGRWHRNKGADLLVDALGKLDDADWRAVRSLEVCGGGPLEQVVRIGIEQLRQAGRPVSVRGFLDKDEAEDLILRADWLLIPSRIESIPVVFSDAMKLGCPVIASPVGDLPALVAGKVGICSTAADATAFAAAMKTALGSNAAGYSVAIADAAARFSLDAIAGRIRAMVDAGPSS